MLRTSALIAAAIVASMARNGFGFPSSRLTYVRAAGAESCPDEREVRRAVAARLGYDPFFPAADKTIVARITRVRDTLRASVELVDDAGIVRGVREFETAADQCEELVATAALAISIAIDPTNPAILGGTPREKPVPVAPASQPKPAASSGSESGAKTGEASTTEPTDVAPTADVADKQGKEAARSTPGTPLMLATGLAIVGALGTAPAVAMGFAAFFGVRQGSFSLALEGRFDLPASTAMNEGGRLRSSLWVGSLVPCFHLDRFFVCAMGSVGSLNAEGIGLATSRDNSTLYAGLGSRVGLEAPLSERLFLRPQIDVVGSLYPANLQVDGATRWTAPRFAASAGIGLGARLP